MKSSRLRRCCITLLCLLLTGGYASAVEVAGVKIDFVDYSGPQILSVPPFQGHRLRIDVAPRTEQAPLTLQVVLPESGRNAWPITDVEVVDVNGNAVPVRRGGIEWHKLLITVPAGKSTFFVQAARPTRAGTETRVARQQSVTEPKTGLSATICNWHDGRTAALSIRFDDSHPTHLTKAIPVLKEYGFRGTFMVNPGTPGGDPSNPRRRSEFQEHLSEWEAVARGGEHELANHTLDHRGAESDTEMEYQVGEASKVIWKLCGGKSRLVALNLGGGTSWTTTKTLRFYLDKYHLFDTTGSTGMDDVYGNRVATFRRLLENHIERGLWYRVHYHYIGPGLSTSEANFRATLDVAKEHQSELWIAGMADIYKYQSERRGARLEIASASDQAVVLKLSCTTEPELYDHPLTIDVTLPKSWNSARIVPSRETEEKPPRRMMTPQGVVLRFDAPPTDIEYRIERSAPK